MIQPLKTELEKLVALNHDLERHRSGAYEGIKRHLKQLEASAATLSGQTTALSTALMGSAQARGNWGEVTLRRLFGLLVNDEVSHGPNTFVQLFKTHAGPCGPWHLKVDTTVFIKNP